jgi:hypothetical protein
VNTLMSPSKKDQEVDLYRPVKDHLESLGFEVKGEIGGCDLVGVRDDGRVVIIGELKLTFTLELVLQAVDRMSAADEVCSLFSWAECGSAIGEPESSAGCSALALSESVQQELWNCWSRRLLTGRAWT